MMRPKECPFFIVFNLSLWFGLSPVFAYDQPWNGNKEDIVGTGDENEDDCPGGECAGPTCNSNTGSPVYVSSGSLVWKEPDVVFPTTTEIGLTRTYNSFDLRVGLFGRGWVTAQESNIAQTYKAVTEGNADGSPLTATAFEQIPIWLSSHGRRYKLEATDSGCRTPGVLFFTFQKESDGRFRQVFENSRSHRIFSAGGVLLEGYSDEAGTTSYYEYDAKQRLTRQFDGRGYELRFTHNENGFVSKVTDQAERSWNYAYDEHGNLVEVEDPDGNTRSYEYRLIDKVGYRRHLLSRILDNAADTVLQVTWKESVLLSKKAMRVIAYVSASGRRHDYAYSDADLDGLTAVRTVKSSKQVSSSTEIERRTFLSDADRYWILSNHNNTKGTTIAQKYSQRGRLTEYQDERGAVTRYEYDNEGRITKVFELAGTDGERVRTYRYAGKTHRIEVANEYGIREHRLSYDEHLRPTSRTIADLSTGQVRTWRYAYHPNGIDPKNNVVLGLVSRVDGPRPGEDDVHLFDYDPRGLFTTVKRPLGQVLHYGYNAAGQVSTITDANGIVTELAYDSRNRQTENRSNGRTLQYAYQTRGQLTEWTDELGRVVRFTYNDFGEPTRITYPGGNYVRLEYVYAGSYTQVKSTYYDNRDKLQSTSFVRRHPMSGMPLTGLLASHSSFVDHKYDEFGDVTETTLPGKSKVTYAYAYDTEGRVTQIADGLDGQTQFGYDAFGQMTRAKDANGGVTSYRYSGFGDLIEVLSPDKGTSRYQYGPTGQVAQRTDGNGRLSTYHYDALDRLTRIDYEGDGLDVALQYDEGAFSKGLLSGVQDGSGSTQYQYDDRGLVTETVSQVASTLLKVTYGYNEAEDLTLLEYPSGFKLVLKYDKGGRLNRIQRVDGGVTTNLLHSLKWAGPNIVSFTHGNGLVTQHLYDSNGRLTEKRYGETKDLVKNRIDQQGTVTRQTWRRGGKNTIIDFGYDPLGRLTEDKLNDRLFFYDAAGNRTRLAKTSTTKESLYTYEPSSNRLASFDGVFIRLDAQGNTLDDGTRQFRYNASGRMSSVRDAQSGTEAVYTYNFLGQRVLKRIRGGGDEDEVRYVYGLFDELLGEYAPDGRRLREYIYRTNGDTKEPVAQVEADGRVTYLHTDHVLTPRLASNANQTVVWRWVSDAFGDGEPDEDPDEDGVLTRVLLRFPGQYHDRESGLFYNDFRDYDPTTGRYVQSDPLGVSGGLNTYIYAGANPLNFVDPTGEQNIPGVPGFQNPVSPNPKNLPALTRAQQCPRVRPAHFLVRALRDFRSVDIRAGNQHFKLTKSNMKHILERHHPLYWNGTVKQGQTFFRKNTPISSIPQLVKAVLRQNRDILIKKGTNSTYQVQATVLGRKYVVGVRNGQVGQFYPVKDQCGCF